MKQSENERVKSETVGYGFIWTKEIDKMLFRRKSDVIEMVAKQHGVSKAEVRREMELAIADAKDNPDPDAQAYFMELFGDRTPTPEEFIKKVSKVASKQARKRF